MDGDGFHVSPLRFAPGLRSWTVTRYDITLQSPEAQPMPSFDLLQFDTNVGSLEELLTGTYQTRKPAIPFWVIAVGIDLSDLGYAAGTPVDGLFLQDAMDDEHFVDPVFVAGLPSSEDEGAMKHCRWISILRPAAIRFPLVVCALSLFLTATGWRPTTTVFAQEHVRFFENEVRPLLVKRCYECHSAEEASGELRLDSLAAMLQGGESGPAIVPGKPDESLLVEAVRYESLEMPPDEKLPDAEIAILTRWIALGAPWPGADPNAPIRERELFDDEDRKWWAIAPVSSPPVPELREVSANWAAMKSITSSPIGWQPRT